LTAPRQGHAQRMPTSPAAPVDRLRALPRAAQRALRARRPVAAAELTWAWKRRQGDPATRVVDDLAGPGRHVLDIGANWGLFTARLGRRVGPGGRVEAFEPLPAHAATLRAVETQLDAVEVHMTALSDHEGEADLVIPVQDGEPMTALAHIGAPAPAAPGERRVPVPVRTLDAVLGDDHPPVDLVKCDVEGHELEVLRGGERTLRRGRPALVLEIEERHRPEGGVAEVFDYLKGVGYEGRAVRHDGLVPLSRFDVERDQLAHLRAGEAIAHDAPRDYVNTFLFVPAR
jgi:FkbM family methyltransferase